MLGIRGTSLDRSISKQAAQSQSNIDVNEAKKYAVKPTQAGRDVDLHRSIGRQTAQSQSNIQQPTGIPQNVEQMTYQSTPFDPYQQQQQYLEALRGYIGGQSTAAQQQLAAQQKRNEAAARSMAVGQRGVDVGTSLRGANQQIAQSRIQNQQQNQLLKAQEQSALEQAYAQGVQGLGGMLGQQQQLALQGAQMGDIYQQQQLALQQQAIQQQQAMQQAQAQLGYEDYAAALREATTLYGVQQGVGVNYAPDSPWVGVGSALGGAAGGIIGSYFGPVGAAVGTGAGSTIGGWLGSNF